MLTNGCFVKVQLLNNDAIFCIHVHFTPHTLTSTFFFFIIVHWVITPILHSTGYTSNYQTMSLKDLTTCPHNHPTGRYRQGWAA